jgi:hypothetical protein
MKRITVKDFESAFKDELSSFVKQKIESLKLSYRDISNEQYNEIVFHIIKTLFDSNVKKAGEHRLDDWIRGWGENHTEYSDNKEFSSLIPKYFGKLPFVRWRQKFIKPTYTEFEYDMVQILQYWLFEKHFSDVTNVYEFGCGTGHNLFRVKDVNSHATIHGLDWTTSSQKIIQDVNKELDLDFKAHNFDFFNINKDFKLQPNSGVYTFAALEQATNNYQEFIDYLVKQKPEICVHIEPMGEYLDEDNLNDYLSIKYFQKRSYVDGLGDYLLQLEDDGLIEIVQDQRSYIGSMFVDGYSILAWKVKK